MEMSLCLKKSCKSLPALRGSQFEFSSWEHARLPFSNAGENKLGLLHTASNSFFRGWALALVRWVFEGPDHRDCLGVCSEVQDNSEIISAVLILEVKQKHQVGTNKHMLL